MKVYIKTLRWAGRTEREFTEDLERLTLSQALTVKQ
jgi:hypothetical protein